MGSYGSSFLPPFIYVPPSFPFLPFSLSPFFLPSFSLLCDYVLEPSRRSEFPYHRNPFRYGGTIGTVFDRFGSGHDRRISSVGTHIVSRPVFIGRPVEKGWKEGGKKVPLRSLSAGLKGW